MGEEQTKETPSESGPAAEGKLDTGKMLGMPFVSLASYPIDLSAVERIPVQLARKHNIIAIGFEGNSLLIALDDPKSLLAAEEIGLMTGGAVKYVLSSKQEIAEAIEEHYAELEVRTAAAAANRAGGLEHGGVREAFVDETPVVRLLNSLLLCAARKKASDLHLEPREKRLAVRMRIDGLLSEYVSLEKSLHPFLIARAKIMAGMDIAEKRLPQDGHIKTTLGGLEMNIRVSSVPTIHGEKVVLRFLNVHAAVDREDTFGMSEENYRKVREILKYSHGLLYLTGPTGSGKTTTLYLILEHLAKRPVNIVTIEDPVEREIDGVCQIQVNRQAGLTFESGLRAILRQDPDVIMVGETRDSLTARMSVRAAITGHFVLSTLHTSDAVRAIARMRDLEVEPFLLADSLCGIVAQRLVRKICPNCRAEVPAAEKERTLLGADRMTVCRGGGCHLCNGTGYRGRIAVHEVVVVDREIRRLISQNRPSEEIEEYVKETQRTCTLRENLLNLVRDGITTPEEFWRVLEGEE